MNAIILIYQILWPFRYCHYFNSISCRKAPRNKHAVLLNSGSSILVFTDFTIIVVFVPCRLAKKQSTSLETVEALS